MKKIKTNSIINDLEFEGLSGFEEIESYTLLREIKKKGKLTVKKEVRNDRKATKKKDNENKLLHGSSNASIRNFKSDTENQQRKRQLSPNSKSCEKVSKKIAHNAIDTDAWRSIFTPEEVITALKEIGFKEPSPIQKYTIPAAIQGKKDIIGAAETGSGKTLAFIIPIIDGILKQRRIEKQRSEQNIEEDEFDNETLNCSEDSDDGSESEEEEILDNPSAMGCVKVIDNAHFDFLDSSSTQQQAQDPLRALIITPTRELAVQVKKHTDAVISKTDIKCVSVIGGLALEKQERLLRKGPEIIIGTPGRLWEIFQQGNAHLAQLPSIRFLAIDETDRMLEKGHFEELKKLLEIINSDLNAKKVRQTFVFSATLTLTHCPPSRQKIQKKMKNVTSEMKIENFARIIGVRKNPKVVDITRKFGTAESLSEAKILCDEDEKDGYLYYFLKCFPGRSLIFCNSINCVKRLSNLLSLLKCSPQTLHASKIQKQRLSSLEKFTKNPVSVLLATDVAARGIDIPGIDHIIHYEVPKTAETYVHRSGRTARANKEGLSVLLVDNRELGRYKKVCTTLNRSNDLPSFPIEQALIEKSRERVDLARQIEKSEFVVKKKKSSKFWFKKMAEEAEIELSDSDNDDDDLCEEGLQKHKHDVEQNNRRRTLEELLSQPMARSYFSPRYPTTSRPPTLRENITVASDKRALDLVKAGKSAFKNPLPLKMNKTSLDIPRKNKVKRVGHIVKKDDKNKVKADGKTFNIKGNNNYKRQRNREKKKRMKSSSTN